MNKKIDATHISINLIEVQFGLKNRSVTHPTCREIGFPFSMRKGNLLLNTQNETNWLIFLSCRGRANFRLKFIAGIICSTVRIRFLSITYRISYWTAY